MTINAVPFHRVFYPGARASSREFFETVYRRAGGAARARKLRADRPEKANAWRVANPDKVKEARDLWRATNLDNVKASRDLWRALNPDKAKAHRALWRAANPDKVQEHKRKALDAQYSAHSSRLTAKVETIPARITSILTKRAGPFSMKSTTPIYGARRPTMAAQMVGSRCHSRTALRSRRHSTTQNSSSGQRTTSLTGASRSTA
jgi:hypothetical protein